MADDEPQIGDQVTVEYMGVLRRGRIDRVSMESGSVHVVFDDVDPTQPQHDWFGPDDVRIRREPTPLELIAGALAQYEREFSLRVGQGLVEPGKFSSDQDRASEVLATLDRAGYQVVPKS